LAREDAHYVVRTHTTEGVTIACGEGGLSPHNFYGAQLYGQVAYHDFVGISVALDERERASLGDKNYLIVRHHGLLACGAPAVAAFFTMYQLQRTCQVHVHSMKLGKELRLLPEDVLERTFMQSQTAVAKG
jgi:ribulose-5-phosphate 4-epimerase/fuculose-1-phosphate aldolase